MIATPLVEFVAFVRGPCLITPAPLRHGWRRWAVLVALYLAGLVVIGVVLSVWQRALHVPAPTAFAHYSPGVLAAGVLLAAPIAEEVLFRGWLTGRPRALWLVAMAAVIAVLLGAISAHVQETAASLGVVAVAIIALAGWWVLRRRTEPPRWFARRFGLWFALSVIVFGLLHLSNYPRLSWALVPMVLPQVWAGLVFGYLRLRHGLPASILAHAVGNAAALTAALLSAHG